MCVERISAMCTAGMPRSRSVALEGRLVGCLYNFVDELKFFLNSDCDPGQFLGWDPALGKFPVL
jgi:hypothetical protein